MNKSKLFEWGKKEFICSCGLQITNAKKKAHIGNELCKELSNYEIESVRGTDKINCRVCNKLVTVCGLQVHMKTHN